MEFATDFFRDEVRCGFYVPTAIKQAWASELSVLSEIDRICIKYGIRYFADWGTILGAVRHGGFIPWDDDLDIAMLREDYIRFRQVADAELPEEYVIHDYERQKDHWLFLARVVNRNRISFSPEDLNRNHNFPYLTGVDIFIKDYLYRDPEKEKERDREVLYIIAAADSIVEGRIAGEKKELLLSELEEKYRVRIDRKTDERHMGIALYWLAEQQMSRVPKEEAGDVGQIFPFILKGGMGQPKRYYEDFVRLPFENTTIPVPASYDTILRNRYGDYLQIKKQWGAHDYPFFESQREGLQSHADFQLPEYRFDRSVMEERDRSFTDQPHRHKVLFLAAGPQWWGAFEAYYRKERKDKETEICIVAVPLLFKNCYGEIVADDEELAAAAREAEYPEELLLTAWYDFDVEEYRPDVIYIQDVYDGENPCLTVPPLFYASYLRVHCGELVCVPALSGDDFRPEDINDVYNMKHYVTAPGIVYADRVLLRSEILRKRYLEKLIAWAGEDTEEYWSRKLRVESPEDRIPNETGSEKSSEGSMVGSGRKRLLYLVGANEMAEYGEDIVGLLESRFKLFEENRKAIEVIVCLYPPQLETWEDFSPKLRGRILSLLQVEVEQNGVFFCDLRENPTEELVRECDAYYGSASPLVPEFVRAKKPVMIADYSLSL